MKKQIFKSNTEISPTTASETTRKKMEAGVKTKKLKIGKMTCVNCQNKIEKKLSNTAGIKSVKVSYNNGTADITYDTDIISLKDITNIIQNMDYEVLPDANSDTPTTNQVAGLLIIIVSLYILLQQFGILNLLVPSQLAQTNMSYGMLFIIGLITSVHCVAMCGGINLSQCIPSNSEVEEDKSRLSALRPTFLYNLGRVCSYTIVGFLVGALGMVFTFSNTMQGILKLIAGLFMIIMGINMLGMFPWLRKLNPRMPQIFARKINKEKSSNNNPLIIGLLNGLMPCGPLQAMQIYALSTGSPITGALSMFLFSLGTVPLMFSLGALGSLLGKKYTHKIMTVGAVLVVVLGLSMVSQGFSLSGVSLSFSLPNSSNVATESNSDSIKIEDGVQIINSTLSSGRYPAITVQANTPVKWTINAPEGSINGCNYKLLIPAYDISYELQTGDNVIEFTPTETGKIAYSCWMGMIRSTITVVDSDANTDTFATTNETETSSSADTDTANESEASSSTDTANNILIQPTPADYTIPTDELAVATMQDDYQQVTIELTDEGFSPAVVVVQSGINVEWVIDNNATKANNFSLLVPLYQKQIPLNTSQNPLYLYPTQDFDFSNADNTAYGYVKVVDSLDSIDTQAIKDEVANYQTLIWPQETFESDTDTDTTTPSCH